MHSTSSNLLHYFPNSKYLIFSLLKKKISCEKYRSTRPTCFAMSLWGWNWFCVMAYLQEYNLPSRIFFFWGGGGVAKIIRTDCNNNVVDWHIAWQRVSHLIPIMTSKFYENLVVECIFKVLIPLRGDYFYVSNDYYTIMQNFPIHH